MCIRDRSTAGHRLSCVQELVMVVKNNDREGLLGFVEKYSDKVLNARHITSSDCLPTNGVLHTACWYCRGSLVKLIIERGANLNQRDGFGNLPLHIAVLNGHRGIALYLVKFGARLDVPNGSGNTPLMIAILNFRTELATDLLKRGAGHSIPWVAASFRKGMHISLAQYMDWDKEVDRHFRSMDIKTRRVVMATIMSWDDCCAPVMTYCIVREMGKLLMYQEYMRTVPAEGQDTTNSTFSLQFKAFPR
eukprot:TRINITY_DN12415_c0_g1_i2.p1 TRINITY_DN12415_c0_g1~~TRINITY_DN12415_c0_g1_i2.p1  ORF type:complete len:248 (+),score=25.75 TRINITY_DN12415_c0_g1_i2:100-843(+)